MRISDLIHIKPPGEPIALSRLQELRDMLDREGENLSLISGAAANELLEEYVTPLDQTADPLYRFLKTVSGNGGRGANFLVRGPRSAGKSHLLAVADLLLEYPRVRPIMAATHDGYETVLQDLGRLDPMLVVPVPLEEHRAHDEHLEDIFFDRTEQELRRTRYGLFLPLSENSYALDLIERHVVPRYGAELDAHVASMPGTQRSWRDLRERDPAAAVAAARGFAQEIGYPLDFRQSRVERLARLLDIINNRHFTAIIWLVDDLGQFLAATGQKAVRNDAAFLEFLGQRSKIAPLYVLGTMSVSLDQTSGIEPYMLANILDNYTTLSLSPQEMRRVGVQRAMSVSNTQRLEAALDEVYASYHRAFPALSFTREELQAAYPLHPLALTCLESIYSRFLAEADGLADFLQGMAVTGQSLLDRPDYSLLSLSEVLAHVSNRLAAHPQAAQYLHEALDYYDKNGPQLFPEAPSLPAKLARQLIVLRLANLSVPVERLAEALGVGERDEPRVSAEQVRQALEQMRLRGRFVDVHRGATPETDAYTIDVEANLTELARRQLLTYKSSISDDDPRLWEAAAAASGPALPLGDLREAHALEVEWVHTHRHVLVQTLHLTSVSADRLTARCAELSDSATVEAVRLYLAEVIRPQDQRAAWRETCGSLPRSRWSWSTLAWIPRELTPDELDRLKELVACRALLQNAGSRYDPKVSDRLVEEASRLSHEVRSITEAAYAEGEVLSAEGPALGPSDLARSRGDWSATLTTIAATALNHVFPGFASNPPRQMLANREPVDALLARLLSANGTRWEDEGRLGEQTEAYLEPLKLAVRDDGWWRLNVEASEAAAEVMLRVRRRDQTPETETGKPVSLTDLAFHMAKSSFGLPSQFLELLLAALIRSGYLVPLDSGQQILQLTWLQPPLLQTVTYVARSPLLGSREWQALTRVCRMLLERTVPRADYALQTELWEVLCASKETRIHEITRLRKIVEKLRERLGQSPEAWVETMLVFDRLEDVFQAINPDLLPATGLTQFLTHVEPLLQGSPSQLVLLLRQMSSVDLFLERSAPDVVTISDYLRSDELSTLSDPDLQARRRQLLDQIETGESLVNDEAAFRRLAQILLSVYKRRYMAWHTRCYRMSVFDRYRSLRTSPELRVLAHLQRLELKPQWDGPHAVELVEAQEAQRCMFAGLNDVLDRSPVCPECGLRLDQEIELVPLEEIREVAEREIAAYVTELRRQPFQEALREYAQALPGRGELNTKLDQLLQMSSNPPARMLLSVLSDDVIIHLNRVLSGKTIRPRDFGQLRNALAGRTLSKQEAQQIFFAWLSGEEDEESSEGDEVIHVEP